MAIKFQLPWARVVPPFYEIFTRPRNCACITCTGDQLRLLLFAFTEWNRVQLPERKRAYTRQTTLLTRSLAAFNLQGSCSLDLFSFRSRSYLWDFFLRFNWKNYYFIFVHSKICLILEFLMCSNFRIYFINDSGKFVRMVVLIFVQFPSPLSFLFFFFKLN